MHGREEWRAFCNVFVTAFPDLTQEVRLPVAARGRTIEVPFCVVVCPRRSARRRTRVHDAATLLRQLGLAPE